MQDRDLFEYAVIRLVPRVEREEFVNIGVVLYCRKQRFLAMRYELDAARLLALYNALDLELIGKSMEAFEAICTGRTSESPIAALDPAERFRWLTANRSSIVQVSPVHPGRCLDAHETLEKLFTDLVRA